MSIRKVLVAVSAMTVMALASNAQVQIGNGNVQVNTFGQSGGQTASVIIESASESNVSIITSTHNLILGGSSPFSLSGEQSYCVIVGAKDGVSFKKQDMIWYVDYNDPYLNEFPDVKRILKEYEKEYVHGKKDSKYARVGLISEIVELLYR